MQFPDFPWVQKKGALHRKERSAQGGRRLGDTYLKLEGKMGHIPRLQQTCGTKGDVLISRYKAGKQ